METTQPTIHDLLRKLESKTAQVKLGGGQKRIDSEHQKGKLTARERIDHLIDASSDFFWKLACLQPTECTKRKADVLRQGLLPGSVLCKGECA